MAESDSTIPGQGGTDDLDLDGKTPPTRKYIEWLHQNASSGRREDLHHAIGFGPTDVAAGDHTHNGRDSLALIPADIDFNDPTDLDSLLDWAAVVNAVLRGLQG